jgi:hypothetical protein
MRPRKREWNSAWELALVIFVMGAFIALLLSFVLTAADPQVAPFSLTL